MANLQGLKIPRGDRGDWPVLEYALIDYVEATLTELENAREGQVSLVSNLQDKYATKSYVQIAIGNPNPSVIKVTDLSFNAGDASKTGYSLQIVGGVLQFSNNYRANPGTVAAPGYSFTGFGTSGFYLTQELISGNLNTLLNFGVNNTRLGFFKYDTITGSIGFVLDGSVSDVELKNDGGISLQYVTAPGSSTFGAATFSSKLIANGTGANNTRIEEALINTSLAVLGTSTFSGTTTMGVLYVNSQLIANGTGLSQSVFGDATVQYKFTVSGTGVNATTMAEASITKLTSTGTGASATTIAEASITKLTSTGTGASATNLAEASITKLTSTGTGVNATNLAAASITKLTSTGTGVNATNLAELNVGNLSVGNLSVSTISSPLFITANQTVNPTNETQLRNFIQLYKNAFISDDVLINIVLPAGGITLTSDLDIGNAFGSNVRIKGNSTVQADALRTNGFSILVDGSLKAGCLDSIHIDSTGGTSSKDPIVCTRGTLLLYAPIVVTHNAADYASAAAIRCEDEASLHFIITTNTATPFTFSSNMSTFGHNHAIKLSQSDAYMYDTTNNNVVERTIAINGFTYGIGAYNKSSFTCTDTYTNISSNTANMLGPTTESVIFIARRNSNIDFGGDISITNTNAAVLKAGVVLRAEYNATVNLYGSFNIVSRVLSPMIVVTGNSDVTLGMLGAFALFRYYAGLASTSNAVIGVSENSSLHVEIPLTIGALSTPAAANRLAYGIYITDNSEVVLKSTTSITEIMSVAGIFANCGSEVVVNNTAILTGLTIDSLPDPSRATYGIYASKGTVINIATNGTSAISITNCSTGILAEKMSLVSYGTTPTFTGTVTNTSPAVGVVGNSNAIITT